MVDDAEVGGSWLGGDRLNAGWDRTEEEIKEQQETGTGSRQGATLNSAPMIAPIERAGDRGEREIEAETSFPTQVINTNSFVFNGFMCISKLDFYPKRHVTA